MSCELTVQIAFCKELNYQTLLVRIFCRYRVGFGEHLDSAVKYLDSVIKYLDSVVQYLNAFVRYLNAVVKYINAVVKFFAFPDGQQEDLSKLSISCEYDFFLTWACSRKLYTNTKKCKKNIQEKKTDLLINPIPYGVSIPTMLRNQTKTITKFVHSCIIWTKVNKGKQM